MMIDEEMDFKELFERSCRVSVCMLWLRKAVVLAGWRCEGVLRPLLLGHARQLGEGGGEQERRGEISASLLAH